MTKSLKIFVWTSWTKLDCRIKWIIAAWMIILKDYFLMDG